MKIIINRKGIDHIVLFDNEDFDLINQYLWHIDKDGYVVGRSKYIPSRSQNEIKMHRLIMKNNMQNLPEIDHINFDKLDNRKSNLRPCNHSQNHMNIRSRGKSKYLGVSYKNRNGKNIRARIKIKGKEIFLGHFNTEEEAAHVYDEAALKYFGEFANLNFKNL